MATKRIPLSALLKALRDIATTVYPGAGVMMRDTAARIFWEEIIGPRAPVRTGLYRASQTVSGGKPEVKVLGKQASFAAPSPGEILPVLRRTPYNVPVHFSNAAGVGTRKGGRSYSPFVEARFGVYAEGAAVVISRQREAEAEAVKAAEEIFAGRRARR